MDNITEQKANGKGFEYSEPDLDGQIRIEKTKTWKKSEDYLFVK